MKYCIHYLVVLVFAFAPPLNAQDVKGQPATAATVAQPATAANRVSFSLKNTLGYHCMFRAEGPGMAYGFTMNRNETVPKNWPVGSKLYFSKNGETNDHYILTITADDAGRTVPTETPVPVSMATLPLITFKLRNNSILPKRVAFITYEPGQTGNGTNIFTMAPYGTSRRQLPVGTKVYLADNAQVDIVMSGKRLDSGQPFLTVKKEDAGKTFNIAE